MKKLTSILIIGLFLSCSKPEPEKLTYQYLPQQPTIIDVEVIPTENVTLYFNDMLMEVNADYFNRYNIAINLILRPYETLSDEVKYMGKTLVPNGPNKLITVHIIPNEYMPMNTKAYAMVNRKFIVLGEGSQTTRTLAHELGHVLGLDHINEHNNVMKTFDIAGQYDTPNDFNKEQVSIMLNSLDSVESATNNNLIIE